MKPRKRYYRHLSSVYRAIKRERPGASDIVIFREIVDGRKVWSIWL